MRRPALLLGLGVVARCLATIAALLAAYYLLPISAAGVGAEVLWLTIELVLFVVVVGLQVLRIVTARRPRLRAVQAMTVIVPLFLIIFARIYLEISQRSPGAFSTELDRSRALYFTVTTFATVGFGDITPTIDSVRLLVATQMLLDLVVLGVTAKLLLGAAERGVAQQRDGRRQAPSGQRR